MKKQGIMVLRCAVILAAILVFFAGRETSRDLAGEALPLELDVFRTEDGVYQYGGWAWDSAMEEVMAGLPCTMRSVDIGAGENRRYYVSEEMFSLDGQESTLRMEFTENRLSEVRFEFQLAGDGGEWFEAQAEKLAALYGEESRKREPGEGSGTAGETAETARMESRVYCWEGENTMLQFLLMSGEETQIAVLGVVRL